MCNARSCRVPRAHATSSAANGKIKPRHPLDSRHGRGLPMLAWWCAADRSGRRRSRCGGPAQSPPGARVGTTTHRGRPAPQAAGPRERDAAPRRVTARVWLRPRGSVRVPHGPGRSVAASRCPVAPAPNWPVPDGPVGVPVELTAAQQPLHADDGPVQLLGGSRDRQAVPQPSPQRLGIISADHEPGHLLGAASPGYPGSGCAAS